MGINPNPPLNLIPNESSYSSTSTEGYHQFPHNPNLNLNPTNSDNQNDNHHYDFRKSTTNRRNYIATNTQKQSDLNLFSFLNDE